MLMMEYRLLREAELVPELFADFWRHQEITHCWCKVNGEWEVQPAPRTIENWNQEQREFVCWCLKEILSEGGMVTGAFLNGALKGILAVEGNPFGSQKQYLAISFLHVSREIRGQGIGKALFSIAENFAIQQGVPKLYISSQSSVETQAFYKAMGCVEAAEYNMAYLAHNPKEVQLELKIDNYGRTLPFSKNRNIF